MPKMNYLAALALSFSLCASADVLEEEKRVEIDALLTIFKTRTLSNIIAQNLTQSMVQALTEKYGRLDPAVSSIIFDEAKVIMYEEYILSGKLNDIFYDLYDEYYTAKQLRELVRFYKTSTGKRLLEVGDSISRRSMQAAQKHAASFGEKAQKRIQNRLAKTSETLEKAEREAKEGGTPDSRDVP